MRKKRPHQQSSNTRFLPVNHEIRHQEVLLIDEDSGEREVISTARALVLANERQLDLVVVAPHAQPPVAKIIDYSKFRYEQARQERRQRKLQKSQEIKEIRLSAQMDDHDINQRIKRAEGFIKEGNRVKLSLRFKGRQMIFREKGLPILENFANQLNMQFESAPRLAGRMVSVLLLPKKNEEKTITE